MDREAFLASLKHLLGVDPDDTSRDAELLAYIEIAIEICEEYLGRDLDATDHSEQIFDHSGDLIVRNWPINSVAGIQAGGINYGGAALRWSSRRNVLKYISGNRHSPICGDYIIVNYNAGYSDNIPQWLLTSVSYIAATYENLRGKGGISVTPGSGEVKKFSIPGVYSEEYDVGSSSSGGFDTSSGNVGFMPDEAKTLLNMYRDIRVH